MSRGGGRILRRNCLVRQEVSIKVASLRLLALNIGQVVRAPDFSFMDALGALEIMDPKTDSGMAVQEEDEIAPMTINSLLPEEVIWIMDQLLAREVRCQSTRGNI